MAHPYHYDGKLPLPRNFFTCSKLSPDTIHMLREVADTTAVNVVHFAQMTQGPLTWSLDVDDRELQQLRAHDPQAPPGTRTFAWTSVLLGSLDEVAGMFAINMNDPTHFRAYCRDFHHNAIDGVRLYSLENEPSRYIGIHWTVTELPGTLNSLTKNRDWCFLEVHSPFILEDGRRGWVRAITSVELSSCPTFKSFVRGNYFRSGHVFVENANRPGYLSVTQLHQVDYQGDLTNLVLAADIKLYAKGHRDLDMQLHAYRLSRVNFVSEDKLVPRKARSQCQVCRNGFGLLSKRFRCRVCAEVVCSTCSKSWAIRRDGHQNTVRICSKCSFGLHHAKDRPSTMFAELIEDDGSNGAFSETASVTSMSSSHVRLLRRFSIDLTSQTTSQSARRQSLQHPNEDKSLHNFELKCTVLDERESNASFISDMDSASFYSESNFAPSFQQTPFQIIINSPRSSVGRPQYKPSLRYQDTLGYPMRHEERRNDIIPLRLQKYGS